VGKHAAQIIGTDVSQLGRDVWAAAGEGGGWVDYDFLNPATGQVAPKTSYIVPLTPELVMGCGIYKSVAVA
jgi:signal transduction histidine kinase